MPFVESSISDVMLTSSDAPIARRIPVRTAGIAAGKALFKIGTVFTDDPVGNYTADFQLTYKDEAVGAANSRKLDSFAMLRVESGVTAVTAVPEPHSAAMLLAGLGAIGWMSRRRRSSRDQVAKL